MAWIGRALTVLGVIFILLPVAAVVSQIFSGPDLSVAIARAPTFVLGGLVIFVIGIALRTLTDL